MRAYNGRTIVDRDRCRVRKVAGHRVTVRKGAGGFLLAWLARQIHHDVEKAQTVYGWRSREVNKRVGGDPRSDHMAGLAIDYNGGRHPWEKRDPARYSSGWSAEDVRRIRLMIAWLGGTVSWGIDYRVGNRDAMHFGITGSVKAVKAARDRLKGGTTRVKPGTVLNVRLKPSTSARVDHKLEGGDRVRYSRIVFRGGRAWLQLVSGGWVAGEYTTMSP